MAKAGEVGQAQSMTKGMNSEYEALGRAGQGMSEKEWTGSSWRERGLGVGDSGPGESSSGPQRALGSS